MTSNNTQQRPAPKGGWPTPEFVESRRDRRQWRVRKQIPGVGRPTFWGADADTAKNEWMNWWNAGCPPLTRAPKMRTLLAHVGRRAA
jgi:hypothetical protein